ncbi:MAG: ABC transporter permease [Anaerolineae bacterium]|jgi:ABC-type transport system involved in multi-copper enzyme maturation permease subunit
MKFKPRLSANPIIVKEIRSRMRGARAFVVLTAMLLLLAGVSYLLYRLVLATWGYGSYPLSPQIGQVLFVGLALLELLAICFITPAVTAGAISSEQEKLTYEMLLTTPLRPASILSGKLLSALGYIFLLIFAAVPMASLVFIFGGISPRDMAKALAILVSLAVTLGVASLFFSAWLKRTTRAMVASYLFVLALLLGPTFVYIFVGVLRQAQPPAWILIPNPISALFSALMPAQRGGGPADILWGLGSLLSGTMGDPGAWSGLLRPVYHYTLVLYGSLSLGLYLLAARLVQPVRRWRAGRRGVLAALAALLALAALVAAGYLATAGRYEWASRPVTPTPFMPQVVPEVIVREAVPVMAEPTMVPPPTPAPTPTPWLTPTPTEPAPTLTPTPVPVYPPWPAAAPTAALPAGEQAGVYATVIRHILDRGQALAPLPEPLTLYLWPSTVDGLVLNEAPYAPSRLIGDEEQEAVLAALGDDLAANVAWDMPHREDGGAIVTLGNLHLQEDGSMIVSATLYTEELGSVGQVYVLELVDGVWQVQAEDGSGS